VLVVEIGVVVVLKMGGGRRKRVAVVENRCVIEKTGGVVEKRAVWLKKQAGG